MTLLQASESCTSCKFGSISNPDRTLCLEIVEIVMPRTGNSTADDDSLVGRAVTAAAEGKFGGKTAGAYTRPLLSST
jgi:hypothetical protein